MTHRQIWSGLLNSFLRCSLSDDCFNQLQKKLVEGLDIFIPSNSTKWVRRGQSDYEALFRGDRSLVVMSKTTCKQVSVQTTVSLSISVMRSSSRTPGGFFLSGVGNRMLVRMREYDNEYNYIYLLYHDTCLSCQMWSLIENSCLCSVF